jgi:DNA-binding transcriptional ArsR family regulator
MVEYSTAALDSVFHALSDATRRGILQQLTGVEMTVGEIAQPYEMSLAAVSKHLRVLERAELVQMERKGNYRMVRLRADTLRLAQNWLAYYEEFWQARLDALAETL